MNDSPTPPRRSAPWARQFAVATELPFLLVGCVLVGGFLGRLLDLWLHTLPLFMLILGGLGFFAGVREMLRRLNRASARSKAESSAPDGKSNEPGHPTDPRP